MFRCVSFLSLATPAAALEPTELAGAWMSEWSNSSREAISGGGPLEIAFESEEALDGRQPSAGLDGLMHGAVAAGENGGLIWSGQWVTMWPEGATRGTFRLVFNDADSFTGVWSSDDGVVQGAAWNGRRAAR